MVSPTITLRCLDCGETWAQPEDNTAAENALSFGEHDRAKHRRGAWLIGPETGSQEMCAPCGGADNDWRTALPGGADHSKCQRGKGRGRGRLCDCQHRTRAQIAALAGTPVLYTPEERNDTGNSRRNPDQGAPELDLRLT